MVTLKCNVASASKYAFRIIANKRGVAHEHNTCHALFRVNNWEQNMFHAPLIRNYSSTSKCLLVSTHDIALERYSISEPGSTIRKVNWITTNLE